MPKRFLMTSAGALLSLACATSPTTQLSGAPPAPPPVLPEFGLVSGGVNDTFVLELPLTSAPPPKKPIVVVEVSSGRMLKAQVTATGGTSTEATVRFPLMWLSERLEAGRLGVALLGAEAKASQLRECTSAEGVHVTVWEGAPLKSRRRWHAYWYAGYDLEPNCEPGEVPPVDEASPEAPATPKTEDAK